MFRQTQPVYVLDKCMLEQAYNSLVDCYSVKEVLQV